MKTLRTYIAALFILVASTVNAQPMNYDAMRNNARFLTDRMAYTLGITSAAIIDDIYRINFDYICGVNDYLDDIAYGRHIDYYDDICYERDRALQYLLGDLIWNRLVTYDYFYRPISFINRRWSFSIYSHDMRLSHYYCHTPTYYHNHYSGGHFFHGIRYRMDHGTTNNIVDRRANHGGTREMRIGGNSGIRMNQRGDNYTNRGGDTHNNNNFNRDNNTVNNNRGGGDNHTINRNNNSDFNANRGAGNDVTTQERNNVNENRVNTDRDVNDRGSYDRTERNSRTNDNNRGSFDRTDRSNRSFDRSNNNVRSSSRSHNEGSSNSGSRIRYNSNSNQSRVNSGSSSQGSSMRNNGGSNRSNNSGSRNNGSRSGGGRR